MGMAPKGGYKTIFIELSYNTQWVPVLYCGAGSLNILSTVALSYGGIFKVSLAIFSLKTTIPYKLQD